MMTVAVGHAVGGAIGQEPDFLNFLIHALLQDRVQAAAFVFDLREVGEFGADADDVGMTAVVGQPQLFAVSCFENDSHMFWLLSVWLVVGEHKKADSMWGVGGSCVLWWEAE